MTGNPLRHQTACGDVELIEQFDDVGITVTCCQFQRRNSIVVHDLPISSRFKQESHGIDLFVKNCVMQWREIAVALTIHVRAALDQCSEVGNISTKRDDMDWPVSEVSALIHVVERQTEKFLSLIHI